MQIHELQLLYLLKLQYLPNRYVLDQNKTNAKYRKLLSLPSGNVCDRARRIIAQAS